MTTADALGHHQAAQPDQTPALPYHRLSRGRPTYKRWKPLIVAASGTTMY